MISSFSLRHNKTVAVFFAAALCVSGICAYHLLRYLLKPHTGLIVNFPEVSASKDADTGDWAIIFAPKTPFSPAVDAGLIPYRDRILKINNRPITSTRDVVEAERQILSFEPVPIAVMRDDAERLVIDVTPVFNLARIEWAFILLFALTLAFLAFYLVFHSGIENASIWILLCCLAYMLFTCVKPFYYESFFTNFLAHVGKTAPWLLIFFAMEFPKPRGSRRFRLVVYISIALLYIAFVGIRMNLYHIWAQTGDETVLMRYRTLGRINNAAEGLAYVAFGILLGTSLRKTRNRLEKRQIEWIFAGYLVALPAFFVLDQLSYILGTRLSIPWTTGHFANLFLLIFPLFYVIGLMKRRIFNFQFFLSRYFVVLFLVVVICSFFILAYPPLIRFFMSRYGMNAGTSGLLVALMLFLLLLPLRAGLVLAFERMLYGKNRRGTLAYLHKIERENRDMLLSLESSERMRNMRILQQISREMQTLCRQVAERLRGHASLSSRFLTGLRKSFEVDENADGEYRAERDMSFSRLLEANRELREIADKLEPLAGMRTPVPDLADLRLLVHSAVSRYAARSAKPIIEKAGDREPLWIYADPEDVVEALTHILQLANEQEGIERVALKSFRAAQAGCLDIALEGEMTSLRIKNQPGRDWLSSDGGLLMYAALLKIQRNGGRVEQLRSGDPWLRIKLPGQESLRKLEADSEA